LGILRRARARGKKLPKQLKTALEIQGEAEGAEENSNDNMVTEYKAYHINQRNEGIDLNGISGALMATQNRQMQTFVTEPMLCLNDQGGE
jgi:DNA (cytosine-5)-methyltransferase 1